MGRKDLLLCMECFELGGVYLEREQHIQNAGGKGEN